VSRTQSIYDTLKQSQEKREKAAEKKRQKRKKVRPWVVFAEEWREEVLRVFGKKADPTAWGPAEAKLARALLKEVELDEAVGMAKRFIASWKDDRRQGLPSFRYFWTVRDSVKGPSVSDHRRQEREYDPEKAKKSPKIGWG
jgi:hypothetical protein